jgi:transcriptional regulator with XRE-family HTH domain
MTLRELRKQAGLLQTDIAKRLKVRQSAVSKWETGVNPPLEKYQKQLARLYGCKLEDIQQATADTVGRE